MAATEMHTAPGTVSHCINRAIVDSAIVSCHLECGSCGTPSQIKDFPPHLAPTVEGSHHDL